MCYYIGIEDLAANALIEILQTKKAEDVSSYPVTFTELEKYGAEVVKYLDREKGEKALLILSRAHTTNMLRNYSDFFEEIETPKGTAIILQKGKTVEDLINKFRIYNAFDVIRAFMVTAGTILSAAGQR
ncbi:MAG: hypothetical protein NC313_14730 [Butyrivibrio sp.]|nr:hypothetical protein [Butyrivibrio sp.]